MSSPDRPSHIPMPPLRSALKHSSRPGTPAATSGIHSPGSLQSRHSPFIPNSSSSLAAALPSVSAVALSATPSMSSPPQSPMQSTFSLVASQGYTPKVSFDTFENPQASMFSYTLHVQSEGYSRNRNTRIFLCAASSDESGVQALDFAVESLVQDEDELIVFRGIDTDDLEKDHDLYREEAKELMRQVQEKCMECDPERKLSIIVECIAGKITTTIDRLIALYRPDSVVVGTRGQRGMMQAWGTTFGSSRMGSVSKYCLSHSPVPIIVVRPENKVRKAMEKRRADPKRGKHFDELTKGGGTSTPMLPSMTR